MINTLFLFESDYVDWIVFAKIKKMVPFFLNNWNWPHNAILYGQSWCKWKPMAGKSIVIGIAWQIVSQMLHHWFALQTKLTCSMCSHLFFQFTIVARVVASAYLLYLQFIYSHSLFFRSLSSYYRYGSVIVLIAIHKKYIIKTALAN